MVYCEHVQMSLFLAHEHSGLGDSGTILIPPNNEIFLLFPRAEFLFLSVQI